MEKVLSDDKTLEDVIDVVSDIVSKSSALAARVVGSPAEILGISSSSTSVSSDSRAYFFFLERNSSMRICW